MHLLSDGAHRIPIAERLLAMRLALTSHSRATPTARIGPYALGTTLLLVGLD